VVGSSPTGGAKAFRTKNSKSFFRFIILSLNYSVGLFPQHCGERVVPIQIGTGGAKAFRSKILNDFPF
ncbi:MAG TPA: hypothetical protein PLR98_13760, partial [Chitinophagaceae bacterium]|nr:hypothetical protein [Chitinophagaceae bacterium]